MADLTLMLKDRSGNQVFTPLASRYGSLQFSTKINGGFYELNCLYPCDLVTAFDWYDNRLNYRLTVYEADVVAWDGRIEEMEIRSDGLAITARGYWSACYDKPYTSAIAGANNADVEIKAILTASCPDISTDQTQIDDPGIAVGGNATGNTYPGNIFDQLASVGGTGGTLWDWYVYEDKIFEFHARNATTNWAVSMRDLAPDGVSLKRSLRQIWNSVYADYNVANTKLTTAEAADTDSQTKFGLTRRTYLSAGQVAAAHAEGQRSTFLTFHKNNPQESDLALNGWVYGADAGKVGVRCPLWRVRGGDVIRGSGLVSDAAMIDSGAADALRIFHIAETRYDAQTNTLSIAPDRPEQTASRLLQRAIQPRAEDVTQMLPYLSKTA